MYAAYGEAVALICAAGYESWLMEGERKGRMRMVVQSFGFWLLASGEKESCTNRNVQLLLFQCFTHICECTKPRLSASFTSQHHQQHATT
jgi:hypothetical protein